MHQTLSRWLAGATTAAAFAAAVAGTADARSLSLGTQTVETGFVAPAIQAFADRVKELSDGELEIEIFWGAQLGSSAQVNQSLVAGAVDFNADVTELLAAFEPRFGVLSMPLVFRDRDHFTRFLGSDIFADMLDSLEEKGIIFPQRADFEDPEKAANWVRPWDRGLITKTPVFTPDDLEGMKIRMYESEIPLKSWQALGANMQVVPWPDTYTALATGVVDGLTGTIVDNYDMKHFETATYWTNVHEYFQLQLPFMSKVTYDSLTPEEQAIIEQAASDAGATYKTVLENADLVARAEAQAEFGVSFIEPPMAPWIEKMGPAHADFEARGLIEEGLIGRIQAIE